MFINCLNWIVNYRLFGGGIGAKCRQTCSNYGAEIPTRGRKYESKSNQTRAGSLSDWLPLQGSLVADKLGATATTQFPGSIQHSNHTRRFQARPEQPLAEAAAEASAALQMLQEAVTSNTCFDRINKSSHARRVDISPSHLKPSSASH